MSSLIAVLSGLLFGIGLLASGMTDPAKVKGFLDLFGLWDPSLALVMGGAISVGLIGFTLASRRTNSWSGEPIDLPKSTVVDWRLVLGGILFGVGWGIAGYCPGPGIVAASAGSLAAGVFVVAMLAGMTIHDRLIAKA
ncbi:MAG: hypothetical protein Q8K29_03895 [Polaromonas sp.]|nr:hypothetical protein [Polaromonas sp.]